MGTRHLTCVYVGGEYKVAQYGQWDGYPSGQGMRILDFCRHMDREKFLVGLNATYEPSDEQIGSWYLEAGASQEELEKGWINMAVADKFSARFPTLSRDIGAKILGLIQNSVTESVMEALPVRRGLDFAADGLFCEWAYVVDLDKNTLEVFEGFNKTPLAEGERFAFLNDKADGDYTPVKHLHTFQLDALPTDEEFIAILERSDDEDEEDDTPALPAPAQG